MFSLFRSLRRRDKPLSSTTEMRVVEHVPRELSVQELASKLRTAITNQDLAEVTRLCDSYRNQLNNFVFRNCNKDYSSIFWNLFANKDTLLRPTVLQFAVHRGRGKDGALIVRTLLQSGAQRSDASILEYHPPYVAQISRPTPQPLPIEKLALDNLVLAELTAHQPQTSNTFT